MIAVRYEKSCFGKNDGFGVIEFFDNFHIKTIEANGKHFYAICSSVSNEVEDFKINLDTTLKVYEGYEQALFCLQHIELNKVNVLIGGVSYSEWIRNEFGKSYEEYVEEERQMRRELIKERFRQIKNEVDLEDDKDLKSC